MDELLSIALIGTAKQPARPARSNHPVDALVSGIDDAPAERKLLLLAGARAVYRRAGRKTTVAPPAPEPAAVDSNATCSAKAAAILTEFLGREPIALRLEAIGRLARAGLRLPPHLIPRALGERQAAVREAVPPVLGLLGQWLCQFNPDWQWLADKPDPTTHDANAETIWSEGSPEQRKAILAKIRVRRPDLGRAWLKKAWPKEKAELKISFLESFQRGLSADDEPFLESCFGDRSQRVRTVAARLLAQLPGTAFGVRMCERGAGMLRYAPPEEKGSVKKLVKALVSRDADLGILTVNPPQEFDKAWEREGVVEKPPPGVGNRAYWLEQIMSLVPPTHWEMLFGRIPGELIMLAASTEFADALIGGWSKAACSFSCGEWLSPLWDYWMSQRATKSGGPNQVRWSESLSGFLSNMPLSVSEPRIVQLLADGDADFLATFISCSPATSAIWSTKIGTAYLAAARKFAAVASGRATGQPSPWLDSLDVAATALPESCFELALEPWSVPEETDYFTSMWRQKTNKLIETLGARKSFCDQVPLANNEEMPGGQK